MARVIFGSALRRYTGGVDEVEIEATTVRSLINALDRRFPGLGKHLESGMAVAIDGEIMTDALYEPVPEDAEVHFLPPIGGG
ncbi:MAG: MoaD/ThiS family protein [Acidimicrobiia bacterium]|nr:MoaD/ThiS family protein [Acidimicrobiia bacterium]MYC84350.1 MoaD/ThiS family protein [Acidimicrobiia bacterium]